MLGMRGRAALTAVATTVLLGGASAQAATSWQFDGRLTRGDSAHLGNSGVEAQLVGMSADGAVVAFITAEPLVDGDVDGRPDLYVRDGDATRLLTPGAAPGLEPELVSGSAAVLPDGRVLFLSALPLDGADDDGARDWYLAARDGTTAALGGGGTTAEDALPEAVVSSDGTRIAFGSRAALTPGAVAGEDEIYTWTAGGGLTLATPGAASGRLQAIAADGSAIVYRSAQAVGTPDGGAQDLFRTTPSGSDLTILSDFGAGANADVVFAGASPGLGTVAFTTTSPLHSGDSDGGLPDLYAFASGVLEWLSVPASGVTGVATPAFSADAVCDDGEVVFDTNENLAITDNTGTPDIYRGSGAPPPSARRADPKGTPTRLTPVNTVAPVFVGASADCLQAAFTTPSALSGSDHNAVADLYLGAADKATLLTATGDGTDTGVRDAAAAPGLKAVAFSTDAPLTSADADADEDAYVWRPQGLTLASTTDGPGQRVRGVSADGSAVVVTTPAPLGDGDADTAADLFRYRERTVPDAPPPTSGVIGTPAPVPVNVVFLPPTTGGHPGIGQPIVISNSPIPGSPGGAGGILMTNGGAVKVGGVVTCGPGGTTCTTTTTVSAPTSTVKKKKKKKPFGFPSRVRYTTLGQSRRTVRPGRSYRPTVRLRQSTLARLPRGRRVPLRVTVVVKRAGVRTVRRTFAARVLIPRRR